MMQTLNSYLSTALGRFAETFEIPRDRLDQMIRRVAFIALSVVAVAFAMWINPYFTMFGIVIGALFPHETEERLSRIWRVIESNSYTSVPILIIFTILKLPGPLLAYSICVGAKLGSSIILNAPDNSDGKRQKLSAGVTD